MILSRAESSLTDACHAGYFVTCTITKQNRTGRLRMAVKRGKGRDNVLLVPALNRDSVRDIDMSNVCNLFMVSSKIKSRLQPPT
jgi:hypothetical protein